MAKVLQVRLSDEEYMSLAGDADREGLSVSQHVRGLLGFGLRRAGWPVQPKVTHLSGEVMVGGVWEKVGEKPVNDLVAVPFED